MRQEGTVAAAAKTMAILEALAEGDYSSLDELGRKLGMPKPTLLRFMRTLASLGYLRKREDSSYALSLKMFRIGALVLDRIDAFELSGPILDQLAALTGETAHLATIMDREAVYVRKVESSHSIRMHSSIGARAALHCTALGKVLLAWHPDAAAIIDTLSLEKRTVHTIMSREALGVELEAVRLRGYAEDDEENEMSVHCISAPVFDHTGAAIAAISVSWPAFRFVAGRKEEYVAQVKAAAAGLSSGLGWKRMNGLPE